MVAHCDVKGYPMKKIMYKLALATAVMASPLISYADVSLSITVAPPALPVYEQPPMPGDGYMWTPGYWSWNDADGDYYWVPGTWVAAPFEGALWTPGYWGWGDGNYAWHGGYWGTHIGYYGGVNYGYGYVGVGYQGGYWNHGAFNYNRSANNVGNVHISNTYNTRVENSTNNRVSYNGGRGGITLQPTRAEASIANMPHNVQTAPQALHEQGARSNQDLRASVNHGLPPIAATPGLGAFTARNIVAARPASAPQQEVRQIPHVNPRQEPHVQPRQQAPMEQQQPQQQAQPHGDSRPQNAPHQPSPHGEERHGDEHHEK
jgi:hypothetical protein